MSLQSFFYLGHGRAHRFALIHITTRVLAQGALIESKHGADDLEHREQVTPQMRKADVAVAMKSFDPQFSPDVAKQAPCALNQGPKPFLQPDLALTCPDSPSDKSIDENEHTRIASSFYHDADDAVSHKGIESSSSNHGQMKVEDNMMVFSREVSAALALSRCASEHWKDIMSNCDENFDSVSDWYPGEATPPAFKKACLRL